MSREKEREAFGTYRVTAIDEPHDFHVVAGVLLAYRNVLNKPRRLFIVASVPASICLALSGFYLFVLWRGHPQALLFFASYLIPLSYLSLSWTRCSLQLRQPRFLLERPWFTTYVKVLTRFFCGSSSSAAGQAL